MVLVKAEVTVRPPGKLSRTVLAPGRLSVQLVGHQPLFPVCPVAHSRSSPLGKGESKQATTVALVSALSL